MAIIKNFIMRIKDYIEYRLSDIMHFFVRLIRIVQYIPVIWENDDSSYYWIYHLLAYKLKRVQNCIEQYSDQNHSRRSIRQIRFCRFLIERLLKDTYCKDDWNKHERKWGELVEEDIELDGGDIGVEYFRKNCLTDHNRALEYEEYKKIRSKEDALRERDLKVFWRNFYSYHEYWSI